MQRVRAPKPVRLLRFGARVVALKRVRAPKLPAHIERRHVVVAAAGCAALAVVGLVDPSRHTITPPCPLKALTGLDCPLCGATRATHALVHGHLITALDFNALYVVALPLVGVLMLVWLVRGRVPDRLRSGVFLWSLLAVATLFAVLRNLPIEPFSVLGTTIARQ
jgi:hypothetical protein